MAMIGDRSHCPQATGRFTVTLLGGAVRFAYLVREQKQVVLTLELEKTSNVRQQGHLM